MADSFDAGAALRSFGEYPDRATYGEIRGVIPVDFDGVVSHEIAKLPMADRRRTLWVDIKLKSRKCEWVEPESSGIEWSAVEFVSDGNGDDLQKRCDEFRAALKANPPAPEARKRKHRVVRDNAADRQRLKDLARLMGRGATAKSVLLRAKQAGIRLRRKEALAVISEARGTKKPTATKR